MANLKTDLLCKNEQSCILLSPMQQADTARQIAGSVVWLNIGLEVSDKRNRLNYNWLSSSSFLLYTFPFHGMLSFFWCANLRRAPASQLTSKPCDVDGGSCGMKSSALATISFILKGSAMNTKATTESIKYDWRWWTINVAANSTYVATSALL